MQKASFGGWALVISPKRSLATELALELRPLLKPFGVSVESITAPDAMGPSKGRAIRLVTAPVLTEAMSRGKWTDSLSSLQLVICENLELLDAEYELGLSLLLHATQALPVRFVGCSTAMADASDLAAWLRVHPASLCSFKPSDRDQDLTTVVQTFSIPHSAALFRAMAKPAHAAIRSGVTGDGAIVFVPSKAQCRVVAEDLITQCAMAQELQGYLPSHLSADDLEPYLARLQDISLVDFLTRGIGIYHEGISKLDRTLILELYAEGIVRVLMVPRDSCWSLSLRAGVVVVMGTQYVRLEGETVDRQVKDYSLAEIVRMQGRAARHMHSGRFYLLCQAESRETLTRFLNEGVPLESTLHTSAQLGRWYHDRRKDGLLSDKQQAVDALSWTFLARRLASNPMYYDAVPGAPDESLSRLVDTLHSADSA